MTRERFYKPGSRALVRLGFSLVQQGMLEPERAFFALWTLSSQCFNEGYLRCRRSI